MKKMLALALALLVFVLLAQAKILDEILDVEDQINQATQALFGSAASQPEIVQALTQLIDCAAVLSESSKYADEIKTQLGIAKNEFSQKSLFSDKGRQKLAFAFRMLTDGQKYKPPKELDEFVTPQQATEIAKQYIEKLVEQTFKDYRAGNQLQAAQNLVELVLMIVTPISGS